MYKKPAAPLPMGGVVDDAVRLYRAAFNRAWVPALMMQLLITATLAYIRLERPHLVSSAGMVDLEKLGPSLIALYLATVIVSLIFSNAVTAQLLATREGQDLSIGGSLKIGLRYFAPTLGIALMFAVIGTLGIVALGIEAGPPALGRVLLVVLYALLVIYFMGRLFLATVALMAEQTSVIGALRASFRVTSGNWWRAATVMTAVLLVFLLALFVLTLSANILTLVVRADTFAGVLAVQLVAAVIQAVTVPFFNAGFVSTYYDLKAREPRPI